MYIGTVLRPRQINFFLLYLHHNHDENKKSRSSRYCYKRNTTVRIESRCNIIYCRQNGIVLQSNFPIRYRSTRIVRVRTINCIMIHCERTKSARVFIQKRTVILLRVVAPRLCSVCKSESRPHTNVSSQCTLLVARYTSFGNEHHTKPHDRCRVRQCVCVCVCVCARACGMNK